MSLKVALIGPESTGKTSLALFLAKALNGLYITEFARTYIEKLDRPYRYEDLEEIAKTQFEQVTQSSNFIQIIDTELTVIKIWSEVKFAQCSEFILDKINEQKIDLYLLCKPDIPWVYDEQREDPTNREVLFERYLKEAENQKLNYQIVSGSFDEREKFSLSLIQKLISEER